MTYADGRLQVVVANKAWDGNPRRPPAYIISSALSDEGLRSMLNQYSVDGSEIDIAYYVPRGIPFASSVRADGIPLLIPEILRVSRAETGCGNMTYRGQELFVATAMSKEKDIVIAICLPKWESFKTIEVYRVWLILQVILIFLVIAGYAAYLFHFIHAPIQRLALAFQSLEAGDFSVRIMHQPQDEFNYIYTRFNSMTGRLKDLVDTVARQSVAAKQAELRQLQAQIKPHFLYNSFFVLETMITMQDLEGASAFARHIAMYFESIHKSDQERIDLESELSHARLYLAIQSARFSRRVIESMDACPEGWGQVLVPRLIIQPIIENAFEHGVERTAGKCAIRVSIRNRGHYLEIIIEDSGKELDDEKLAILRARLERGSEGSDWSTLDNISHRLKLDHGASSGLTVSRSELGGLRVELRIFRNGGESC